LAAREACQGRFFRSVVTVLHPDDATRPIGIPSRSA
jgi:hypothetical protein